MGAIVTNILVATEDCNIIKHGTTTGTVLRIYLDQYKVEHTNRLMKSGMDVDSAYVRTLRRTDILLFVVVIVTMVFSIIDALFQRSGTCLFPTVKKRPRQSSTCPSSSIAIPMTLRSPDPEGPRTVYSPTSIR